MYEWLIADLRAYSKATNLSGYLRVLLESAAATIERLSEEEKEWMNQKSGGA